MYIYSPLSEKTPILACSFLHSSHFLHSLCPLIRSIGPKNTSIPNPYNPTHQNEKPEEARTHERGCTTYHTRSLEKMSPAPLSDAPTNGGKAVAAVSKPNIAVYTNPNHDLWISEAQPSLESARAGSDLKEGEVTVAIRSTGICG